MKSFRSPAVVFAVFDEPNLIADAGLVPLVRPAERCGLPGPVARGLRIGGAANGAGAHPSAKAMSLVAAVCAGADRIADADRLRHGARHRLFAGVRAPSPPGGFLRAFTHGHNRRLHAVPREFLARLARHTPLPPGAGQVAFLDIDPTHRRVHGRAKQGAEVGRFKGRRMLPPILAALSTPSARPVIAAGRLRWGKAAAPFTAEAPSAAHQAGAAGTVVLRADGRFRHADACRRAGAHFSLTVRTTPHLAAAIGAIPEDAWTALRSPEAHAAPGTGEPVSDAEVAEVPSTAFTGRTKAEQVTARPIVRRVRRLNAQAAAGQGASFTARRYHPVSTDSPLALRQAELHHRRHAVVEQVIADGRSGALAHLPSGTFQANAARLTLWAIAFNLLRAAGSLAGSFHARATTGPLRAHLINVPARIARTLTAPDHPAARAEPEPMGKSRADRRTPHALDPGINPAPSKRSSRDLVGGFGLSPAHARHVSVSVRFPPYATESSYLVVPASSSAPCGMPAALESQRREW